jgi:hypothetical protein
MQLSGEEPDLTFFAKTFTGRDLRVFKEGTTYFISSDRFDGLEDAWDVKREALILADILNGVGLLALNGTEPVTIGNAVYRDDAGKSGYHLLPETGVYRLRGIPATLTAMLEDDTSASAIEPPVKEWALLALGDPEVQKVMRINALGPLDWVNLYRILEIISKDVGGLKVIADRKWMSRRSITLFKHTADSSEVLGLEARHGVQNHESPSKPMTITDARKLLRILTWHWLQSKR